MSRFFYEKDPFAPIKYGYAVQEEIFSLNTEYNNIKVIKNEYFGYMLILDDIVQLTERDEYFYHEMLAHVAMHSHSLPSDVLIIGGGDGGTLREVVKHNIVRRATVVEIDKQVIEVSKRFFPALSVGFDDPRTDVVAADGADFISRASEEYDIIIVDSTDPVGYAKPLFSDQFFSDAYSALKENGIFVAQTESLHFHLDFVRDVQNRLAQIFKYVNLYTVPLATYGGNWWTFSIASKGDDPRTISRKCEVVTKYYAEDVHRNSFLTHSLYKSMIDTEAETVDKEKNG
jgi:spermidine synthase